MWRIESLIYLTILEFKFQLRELQVVVYQVFFPVFLLILFQAIWGNIPKHIYVFFPGIVGMTIASSSFYGIGVSLNAYERYGTLKYWKVTPLGVAPLIVSLILSRILFVLLTSILLLIIAAIFYHLQIISLLGFFVSVIGIGLSLSAIGALVAAIAKNPGDATGIASFIFFPMVFLSGAFFSVEYGPRILFTISNILPLTAGVTLLRSAIEGESINLYKIFLLLIWGIVSLFFACFLFKFKRER